MTNDQPKTTSCSATAKASPFAFQERSRVVLPLVLLLLAFAGALAFRLPALGNRPMHADESVNAIRFRQHWQQGRWVYDPHEHHGPTLSYSTLPVVWATSPKDFAATTAATYRIVPALFGAALVLLLWLLRDAVGGSAAVWAGVLTAISPALVFYSRYYIHETLLIFFTLAMIAAAWRYVGNRQLAWCLAAGAAAGLMQATKETSVLAFAAMALAWVATAVWNRFGSSGEGSPRPRLPGWHLAAALATAVVVAVTLLSSFFTNPLGPVDGVRTYLPWLERAGGQSPHVQPWTFYLHLLAFWRQADGPWWSEGLVWGLAVAGWMAALFPAGTRQLTGASPLFVRWLGFYVLILCAAYCVIPYKTPWCLLGFHHGAIVLAGVGAAKLIRAVRFWPLKTLVAIGLVTAAGHLGWQAYRASFVMSSDMRTPYVYAHTLPDVQRLADDVQRLAQAAADGHATRIDVIWADHYYWPLPWYLRMFQHIGYWGQPPGGAAAPIVIASPEFDAALTEQLEATHLMTGYYGLRPNVLAQLWVRLDVWEAHLRRLGRL